MKKIANEEIVSFVVPIAVTHRVMSTRKNNEFEIPVGLDESVDELHRAGWIHIVVHLTHHEHQRSI